METRKTRRQFSKEFKAEAVRLCETRSPTEVAESLGVTASLLSRWKSAAEREGNDAFRGNGNRTALEEELRRLRKENADLREEKEILKKAAAYFAKYHK